MLGLLGLSAYGKQRFSEAIDYWQRALPAYTEQAHTARTLRAYIQQAQSQLELSDTSDHKAAQANVAVSIAVSLSKRVDVSAKLLCLFMRACWQGELAASQGRMPLAITRLTVKDLPITVTLSDAMAMRPDLKLSDALKREKKG